MSPEEQILLLEQQLKLVREQYTHLWNQHKLLRLSYRSLKTTRQSKEVPVPIALNENFQALLYGMARSVPLEFQRPKRRRKDSDVRRTRQRAAEVFSPIEGI